MREIKFRAWDKDKKIMKYEKDICYSVYEYSLENNCNLMQYTGLKDKNSKEIYEGDIVTHETLGTEGGKYVITYLNGLHNVEPDFLTVIKVIGNIYENSELMR